MPLKHSVEEIILDNGAKGLLINVPDSTVVAYHVNFRAGYDYVDPSIQQTPHLMEHLIFGINEQYPTAELFSQELSKNGASRGASTSDGDMSYFSESALMEWDRILDLMKLAITKPKFVQKSLDAEKGNVREELIARANDHSRVLWQQVQRAMGSDRLMDDEKISTIDRVRLSDIYDHQQKTHTLQNMRFSLVGDLSSHKDEIIDKLNSWDLPVGERLPALKIAPKSSPAVCIHRSDLSNLTFSINMKIDRELSLSELNTMGALNHILTGTFHSRIFGKARSLGICYSMGSGSGTDISGTSSWSIGGRVGFDNADALFNLIVDQMQEVIKGNISDKELDDAKQYAIGGHQMKGQTVNSLSNWYSYDYFDYERIDLMDQSTKYINDVTLDGIVNLASEFIEKSYWTLGGIGNISEKQLQKHYDTVSKLFNRKVK